MGHHDRQPHQQSAHLAHFPHHQTNPVRQGGGRQLLQRRHRQVLGLQGKRLRPHYSVRVRTEHHDDDIGAGYRGCRPGQEHLSV